MTNLVALYPNLARAYEIALLGNYSIKIVFDRSEYEQAISDYNQIKAFFKDVNFAKDGDLIVKISKPDYLMNTQGHETLSDIIERVNNAKNNTKPSDFKNDSCDLLLKTAIDRLHLSFNEIDKIVDISKTIAMLQNSKLINSIHLAEAIGYRIYDNKGLTCIEDNTVHFNGITIKMDKYSLYDIGRAILYLQSL